MNEPLFRQHDDRVFPFMFQHPTVGPEGSYGMSLRDYFAAAALQGLLAAPDVSGSPEGLAKWAYKYSDAMLAEHTKGGAE